MRPYVRAANVDWRGLNLSDVKTMNFTDEEMETYCLLPGDLLLSEASGSAGEVGKPAIWTGEIEECAFQNTLVRVRSRGPEPKYLLHFFRHLALSRAFADESRGVGIHHIGRAKLAGWLVPLPPIEEQRRIVDLLEDHLSHLDAAVKQMQTVSARLARWRKAAVNDVLRRHRSGLVELRELVGRVEAGRSYGSSARPASGGEWGIIKVSAMTWGMFRPTENKVVADTTRVDPLYEIRPGDVLVSRANTSAYVGAAVLVRETPERLLLSDKSIRLTPKAGYSAEYLIQVLSAPDTRRQMSDRATGTKDSMRNISQPTLLGITVPDASPEAQAAVVSATADIDASLKLLSQTVEVNEQRAGALRRALLAAAFSGQLAG